MTEHFDILIVGGGHGGAQAATALRQQKFAGTIAIVGEETELPYERPPLSKEYLSGEKPFERLLLSPASTWEAREVQFILGRRVVAVNTAEHAVMLEDAAKLTYGKLIWSTGGHARRLSCTGHDVKGVHSVRNRADVDRMIEELPSVSRVVVVGGGYVGLEAAAVLAKLGKHVTVLEALDRVLARVAGEALSRFYEAEHRRRGVDIHLNTTVACIEERDGRASGVRVVGGSSIATDMVIVGIGVVPAIEPLVAAGANAGNGVIVDEHCRTSLPDVFAIGDCALHANYYADGSHIRLESVQNANSMAATVARAITGEMKPYHVVPMFWSKQYDLNLQTMGLSMGHDQVVQRGSVDRRSFSLVYLKAGRVVALDCVNATVDYVQGRALIQQRATPDLALLADTRTALKDCRS